MHLPKKYTLAKAKEKYEKVSSSNIKGCTSQIQTTLAMKRRNMRKQMVKHCLINSVQRKGIISYLQMQPSKRFSTFPFVVFQGSWGK